MDNLVFSADYLQQDAVINSQSTHLQAALDHIDAKYGGVLQYLTRIGITQGELWSIKRNVALETT